MATIKTLIGNIKGPKGDKGDKGDTGAQGPKGATGATGPQGATGATGAQGPQGEQGNKGDTGTRGSRWTTGTAITGTSTTAAVFSGTGITDALVNDMYLNSSTGNTYRCTTAGNASTAKWVYAGNIKGVQGDKGDIGNTGTRGSRWTAGTAITGTSTTATIFSGTGITDALVNDMYLNSSTGNTYRCTTAGNASTAKWVYAGNIKGVQGDKGDKGDTPTDATSMTTTFAQASTRANIASGEKQSVIMGKIKKWFADLTAAAFAQMISSYSDLMANTASGYLADALAVKEGFNELNSNFISSLKAEVSSPFLKIDIPTSDGVKSILCGSTKITVDISIAYESVYIGDFVINIPESVRPTTDWYSIQLSCNASGRVVLPAMDPNVTRNKILGWLQSSIKGASDVTIYVFGIGY